MGGENISFHICMILTVFKNKKKVEINSQSEGSFQPPPPPTEQEFCNFYFNEPFTLDHRGTILKNTALGVDIAQEISSEF